MPTYPLPTLAPTVDASGISAPTYDGIYQSLIASFQSIYGSGIYVSPDSQDGQWLAVLALAIHESNQAAIAVFQSFSPTYSQGEGLSSLVKINGLLRLIPSKSTVLGNVVGVAGTIVSNGVVQDANSNLWNLPASVAIPIGGSITVTATAQKTGSIVAPSGSVNKIYNPQLGWQSFTSTADSVPGNPVEADAQLRGRQSVSTSLPALAIRDAIYAAIANVIGVTRLAVYENDTSATDANGVPAHSISAIIQGGLSADIAVAIGGRKPPGIQTHGSTSVVYNDLYGLPININYYALTSVPIYFDVTIKALTGYVSTTGVSLKAALAAFVNALEIGEDVYNSQAQASAGLIALPEGQTFYISAFKLGIAPSPSGTANLAIAFNAAATCDVANIALTVT